MKSCIYIVLIFFIVSCEGETSNQKRSNDKETFHRLNYVNIVLPKAYLPLDAPDLFGPEYEWLTEGLNLEGTASKTIFHKKENDKLQSIVQIETKGRKVTMNGANYNEFLGLLKNGLPFMPISITAHKIIEDKYELEPEVKYFKVKSLLYGEEGNGHFTCYLLTNSVRTIGVAVWNLSEDQDDLESFAKRFELY